MAYRLSVLLIVSGCIFSLLSGCSFMPQHESSEPKTSDSIVPPVPVPPALQPAQPAANPPKCELPIPSNQAIEVAVARFSEYGHQGFQIELDRACNYVLPVRKLFENRGLPPDLVYVALVESGFTPRARSRANAVGMWQIISKTGAHLGLLQNRWIDERCNPTKAAQAAADYLSQLYDTFGNWPLALAAYNAGPKTIQNALDRSGLKTFWELAAAGWLPAETRQYVPKVYAAVIIARNPDRYGFQYNPDHYVARYEKVAVPGGVKLAWVGKKIGVSKAELLHCNPELCQPVTPPSCSEYQLCVPRGCRDDVLAALANHLPCEARAESGKTAGAHKTIRVSVHKVSRGETWDSLARRYKCPANLLATLNHSRTSKILKVGQLLKVPVASAPLVARRAKPAAAKFLIAKRQRAIAERKIRGRPKKAAAKRIHYKVTQGDTLWTIAERFHVPVSALCTQNDLRPNQKIRSGSRILICTSLSCTRAARRRR